MNQVKLLFVAGARPNFMKIAPLMRLLRNERRVDPVLVHTGQHYDECLSGQFFRDLEIPAPHHCLNVGSGTHGQQTAEVMRRMEPIVDDERPDGVVVVGDVNSTVAAAMVAAKARVPVVHVEAGLRSFDRSMPEEINRVITDSISDLLLATEESGRRNLLREGISARRVHVVGNLMIDSLKHSLARAQRSDVLQRLGLQPGAFGLVTLHRPANVDSGEALDEILGALGEISQTIPLVFPVHPRTRGAMLRHHSHAPERLLLIEPLGYLDFLCMMSHAAVVLTDSGGIQEETTALGIPCLTLRENTERPITVELGTNTLAGTRKKTILAAWEESRRHPKAGRIPPLWDGAAAQRSLTVLLDHFGASASGHDRAASTVLTAVESLAGVRS
jgi:UDP-N-acetylglucosamine 2-epimerase (non-hydrolysing)